MPILEKQKLRRKPVADFCLHLFGKNGVTCPGFRGSQEVRNSGWARFHQIYLCSFLREGAGRPERGSATKYDRPSANDTVAPVGQIFLTNYRT